MLIHPQFDPAVIHIGSFAIHWYGLMYLMAFVQFLLLGRMRIREPRYQALGWTYKDLEDLLFAGVLGVVLGGRLGYTLFYMPGYYLANPLSILKIWEGGMSFHGGLLGVLVALAWFAHQRKTSFLFIGDLVAPLVPFGLAFGRLGNFINGELWGRPTDLPWGMVFPLVDSLPRHPSQIYQLFGEGLLLGTVLWIYSSKPRRLGQVSGLFLLGYGLCRFLAEYAREPDAFLGLLGLGLSMGQWLCVPMIFLGGYLLLVPKEKASQNRNMAA
ncbi:Prolipoprotein diacylglyceryl transferase [Polynucleobacter meluiroseus]|uniref:Phosphatidylglycerol--prolipoprotein diacylglyceryl transferase n=1 Tax=Polynucleobacter meluiroseus TaxID=1938814 RepID=A0A240E1D0_9BURK|nr:prolipoprotein diacylglyceryl transferase [Polynucleobacter meluiroseus]SNX29248.1 Prolipoprotein diacylglyceryl transferase [Polynucleobacter meluiroseus]